MGSIALLLAAAAAAHTLARALRIPPIPLLVGAGIALGGVLPGEFLDTALILGVTFLLFVTGIELSPAGVMQQRGRALRVGLVQFSVMGLAGFAASLLLGFDPVSAAFLALALTASSTLLVVRLLRQRRQMYEPFARLVLGVLLLQDILVIGLIPLVTRAPHGPTAVALGVLGIAVLLLMAAITARWGTRLLARIGQEDEPFLLAVLAILFIFLGAADVLGLPLVVGAFLAGVAIASFPTSALTRPNLAPIGDFFSAVFFTALGAIIGVPSLAEVGYALLLAGFVVLGTPPLVTWIAERTGFSARPAIESGLLLAQTSELSLVVGLYGMIEGEIEPGVFTIIALVTLLTMLLTPMIAHTRVAWWLMHLHPVRRSRAQITPPEGGHVLVLGSGTTGLPLVETLLASGYEVVVVDDDPTVVAQLGEAELSVIRGDATDTAVLDQARARQARLITSTIRRPEDNRRLLEYVSGVPVLVRVFEDEDAEWVRELGGTPVVYSDATAAALLEWLEAEGLVRQPA
ncbi:MAG: cation:proton antiporter [Gemmatimonadota bacterium]